MLLKPDCAPMLFLSKQCDSVHMQQHGSSVTDLACKPSKKAAVQGHLTN